MEENSLTALFTVTEVELTYRNQIDPRDRVRIKSSVNAYDILSQSWNKDRIDLLEQFKILLLNRGGYCLGMADIATGGTAACLADPKIIFVTALKANASSIILAHNHPSGNLKPSEYDLQITGNLCKGARLLDIDILDHLIITRHGFYSMADENVMPPETVRYNRLVFKRLYMRLTIDSQKR